MLDATLIHRIATSMVMCLAQTGNQRDLCLIDVFFQGDPLSPINVRIPGSSFSY